MTPLIVGIAAILVGVAVASAVEQKDSRRSTDLDRSWRVLSKSARRKIPQEH